MDKSIVNKYYIQILRDLNKDYVARDQIFEPYNQYLKPLVANNDIDAILQYSTIMSELNYDEQEIIDFLEFHTNLIISSGNPNYIQRLYVNLAYYYLASDIDYSNPVIYKYLTKANECNYTAETTSMLGYYYYKNNRLQEAKEFYEQALHYDNRELDRFNYIQLDTYLNNLNPSQTLKQDEFEDADIIECITELNSKNYLDKDSIEILLGCNLLDCIIHNKYN